MKFDLNFSILLRFLFVGTIFLLLVGAQACSFPQLLAVKPEAPQITLGVGLAFLIGALIQSLHRALVYPFALRILHRIASSSAPRELPSSGILLWPYCIGDLEVALDQARWRRRRADADVQTALDAWNDQVQFLYGASEATLLALIGRQLFSSHVEGAFFGSRFLLVLGVAFAVAAVFHDWRALQMEIAIFQSESASAAK